MCAADSWPASDPRYTNVDPKLIFNWIDTGTFTFYGFNGFNLGGASGGPGVILNISDFGEKWGGSVRIGAPLIAHTSNPDVSANSKGMEFWDALKAGRINGTTMPFNICDYVTVDWEE